jgi:quinol monooxygenase YgiN
MRHSDSFPGELPMYVVTVHFQARKGQEQAFLEAMKQQARNSLEREDACLQFDVCTAPGDPGHIFLYEVYSDEAAFQAHLETAHFHEFNEATADWLESKQVDTWHRVPGSPA